MAVRITGGLSGDHPLMEALAQLRSPTVRNRIKRLALRKAQKPLRERTRALARKESGLLKKSIGTKEKTYKNSGVVMAIVGPRSGFKRWVTVRGLRKLRNPVRTAHLVEQGTRAHDIPIRRGPFAGTVVHHPGAHPYPFLEPAWASQKSLVETILKREIEKGIVAEWSRGAAAGSRL